MIKILHFIDKYLFITFLFLYPIFFLPIFSNNYTTAKLFLLVAGVLTLSLIKIAKAIIGGNLKLSFGKIDLLVVLIALIYLFTGLFITPNRFDALFVPGTSSFIIFGSLLYFFSKSLAPRDKRLIEFSLILSAFFVSISQILAFVGLTKINLLIFENLINNCIFIFLLLPVAVYKIFKLENTLLKIIYGIISFIIFVAGFTNIYLLLPTNKNSVKLPSFRTSWVVAVDTIKQKPYFGSGPSTFLQSYNLSRPLFTNMQSDWDSKYLVSRNTIFNSLTEIGLLGTAVLILLFIMALIKPKFDNPNYVSLLITALSMLFLPIFPSLMPVIFVLLALNNEEDKQSDIITSKTGQYLIIFPFLTIIIVVLYYSYLTFYPEYLFSKGIKAIAVSDNKKVFENINKAISINPNIDRYHQTAREINLALLRSFISKENLSDEDKNTLVNLIQQTIVEAKATISLNPKNALHWESLGDIYAGFITITKGADEFAIQSYNQAIALDQINPTLRIKLGGVYMNQKKFDEAIKSFELATLAKPDLPNAHYNLAIAYKENGQSEKAKEQLTITLNLVDKNSSDYETAKKELDQLEIAN